MGGLEDGSLRQKTCMHVPKRILKRCGRTESSNRMIRTIVNVAALRDALSRESGELT